MKYIKLFEKFSPNELPNFRVNLVNPGMSRGKYLFTCTEGKGNSYWGIFDLEGLKVLEDSMNTRFVIEELQEQIIHKGEFEEKFRERGIHWSWEDTSIVVNKVSDNTKFIAIFADYMDMHSDNILYMNSTAHAIESKDQLPEYDGLPEWKDEAIKVFPADVNTLYEADHHWSTIDKKRKDYFGDDSNPDPISLPFSGHKISIEDIHPYMNSIIDAGIPKGFLRIIKRIQ